MSTFQYDISVDAFTVGPWSFPADSLTFTLDEQGQTNVPVTGSFEGFPLSTVYSD